MSGLTRWSALRSLVILGIGCGIAFLCGPFWVQLFIGVAIAATLSVAWDMLSRTGQVSLASAAFFGLGAYGSALSAPLLGDTLCFAGAGLVCALAAVVIGAITLRLRRMYFTIATLGLSLSMQVAMLVFPDLTGGATGITPPLFAGGNPVWQLAGLTVLVVVAALVSDILIGPRYRPAFFMIRSNPGLAAASGVPVVRTKIFAFVVSGVFCGLAGACYGGLYGYVVPADVFTLDWAVLPLASSILGGMDTTLGPILGAALMRLLEQLARSVVGGVGYQVVYGAVIILCVLVLPTGLMGLFRRRRRRRADPARRRLETMLG